MFAKLPAYQSVPEISLTFVLKQRLRLIALYFGSIIFTTKEQRRRLQNTKKLRDTKRGKSVVLCASGPGGDKFLDDLVLKNRSLNEIDVAVVNSFYKSKFSDNVSPNYYFLSDPHFWSETSSAEESRIGIINFLKKNSLCYLVVPFLNESLIEISQTHFLNNLVYFKKNKKLSPIRGNMVPSSVVFHAISFLSYLGYAPIYINGLDVSFHTSAEVNKANELILLENKLYGNLKDEYVAKETRRLNLTTRDSLPLSFSGLLISESIMLRDLNFYSHCGLVNIGEDSTNDSIPRACLILNNDKK
jgi:hypothetical protein